MYRARVSQLIIVVNVINRNVGAIHRAPTVSMFFINLHHRSLYSYLERAKARIGNDVPP